MSAVALPPSPFALNGAISHPDVPSSRRESDDARLFGLFAEFAQLAGREDLHDEFRRRATGAGSTTSSSPSHTPNPEAERKQAEASRLVREGKFTEAEARYREAIRLDRGAFDIHGNLGVALAQQRKLPEAEAAFRLAIRLNPTAAVMYVNLTTCLLQQGRFPETEKWARQAIQLDPDNAEPHHLLGCSLEGRNKLEPAEAAFREAVRLNPRHADAQYRFGRLLARLDKPKEAEAALRESLKHKPKSAAAWSALGMLLEQQDRAAEAVECASEALKYDPESADLHNCLGVALAKGEKFAEAEVAYREAIRRAPKMPSAWSNLGNAQRSSGRVEEAVTSLNEALRLAPDYPEAHNNIAIALVQLGRDEEALKHYDEAIRLRPDYPEARMNRSLSWLAHGDFVRGWPEYEWRFKVRPMKGGGPPGPRWEGQPFEGKTLLLTAEQGLGDSVQFVRYARLAKARGAKVVLDCPEGLVSLVATCPGLDEVFPRGKPPGPVYNFHLPLLSLPGLFGVPPEAAVAPVPYLTPDPERVEYWRKELADVPGLKVGISWQGSTSHKGDKLRSVKLTQFAPLAAIPGVTLVSMQKGFGTEQLTEPGASGLGVIDFGARTKSEMMDAAALMANLDLIVSVDTALVHVAGAIGRPVWVAVTFAADWRWLREGETTAWYPTMRLFRQTDRGDWDGVFGRLAVALAAAARAKAEGDWDAGLVPSGSTGGAVA
jgi:tetratricopeptide (TPR) repeat protein